LTGGTSSGGAPPAGFPVTAGFDNFTGATQAFLTKLDPAGAVILFSRSAPTGTLNSVPRDDPSLAPPSVSTSIGLDAAGNVYVSGSETRAAPSTARLTDAFMIAFNPAFALLTPEFFVGGTGDDLGLGRAVVAAYYRVSPSFAGVVARHESLQVVTRAVLRPVIWTARVALVSPRLAFIVLIGAASALVALLAAVVLVSYGGLGRRRAAV